MVILTEYTYGFFTTCNKESIKQTITSLRANGTETEFVETSEETKALALIPQESEVMTMTSVINNTIELTEGVNTDNYHSIRNDLIKQMICLKLGFLIPFLLLTFFYHFLDN